MPRKLFTASFVFVLINSGISTAQTVPLPQKNELPIDTQSLCSGFTPLLKATEASFHKLVQTICPAGVPAEILNKVVANPYRGGTQASPYLHWLNNGVSGKYVRINFVFSLSVPNNVVATVLGDDKAITLPYKSGSLKLNTKFIEPPANNGEADATLGTEQIAICRSDRVNFDDKTTHKMLLFKMYSDNYDFFALARILNAPTEQTQESNMLMAYMPDPKNTNHTIIINVVDYLVNNRGYPAQVSEYIQNYFLWYIKEDFKKHVELSKTN